MNVGFDIDNVIADLDKTFLKEFLKEDKNKRNNGIINKTAEHMTNGMFDWNEEEINNFLVNNMDRMARKFDTIKGSKKYINKIKKHGNKIFLITGRNKRLFKNPEELTKEWLKEKNIYYDKLIFTKDSKDKSLECIENKIDIMFEDRPINCINLQKNGIKSYMFKTRYNWRYNLNVEMVNNWKDLYIKLKEFGL